MLWAALCSSDNNTKIEQVKEKVNFILPSSLDIVRDI
jgi:hypothetical protein